VVVELRLAEEEPCARRGRILLGGNVSAEVPLGLIPTPGFGVKGAEIIIGVEGVAILLQGAQIRLFGGVGPAGGVEREAELVPCGRVAGKVLNGALKKRECLGGLSLLEEGVAATQGLRPPGFAPGAKNKGQGGATPRGESWHHGVVNPDGAQVKGARGGGPPRNVLERWRQALRPSSLDGMSVTHTQRPRVLATAAAIIALLGTCTGAPGAAKKEAGPAKAVVQAVSDPSATQAFQPNPAVVARMVDAGLRALANRATTDAAWRALVRSNDVVGFKVLSTPGAVSGTRPDVVRALVESLKASGHPASKIVIWDRRLADLQRAGWVEVAGSLGVRCAGAEDTGWDPDVKAYDHPVAGRLIAGDLGFGNKTIENSARLSHVTRLLTRGITKVISVAPVLNHNYGGVNGHLMGLALGSVDNVLRFSGSAPLLAEVVPEICALDDINSRVAFGVSDALVCQYRGEESTLLHYAEALNELRFSRDLVALDSMALADVERARATDAAPDEKPFKTDLYTNAEVIELGVADRSRIDIRHP
jgi:hypothetical protein